MEMEYRCYTPREGHPDLDACMDEARDLASAIRPHIKKASQLTVTDRLEDAARKAKGLATAAGNFVINRRRYREGNHAFRPLYAIWTMLNACNFRCSYCDNHQGEHYYDIPDPGRLDTEKGKRLLEVIRTGTAAIYWCGGEPTLREDLPELLDYAWKIGYFPSMINTNGSILHKRLVRDEWGEFLWKLDVVIVSLDGLELDRLAELWGTTKAMARQVLVNLLALRELKKDMPFKLAVNTVVTPANLAEAGSVLDLMCDLGIWYVPVPVNFKHEPNRALVSDSEYVKLVHRILERKRKGFKIVGSSRLLRKLLFAEKYRCLTTLKPHVWSNGQICWPCRASVNVAPVNIDLLEYASLDQAYEAGRRSIDPNFFHGPSPRQCGGDCAWMQNYTTARYGEGLAHPLRSGILQEMFEFALDKKNW